MNEFIQKIAMISFEIGLIFNNRKTIASASLQIAPARQKPNLSHHSVGYFQGPWASSEIETHWRAVVE
ncbi:hypothetical protein [Paraburkholderia tropica]|uniref:hypothetical protein n=1 Tax=Paraburkholderia tropica TaxID=92647 RepID=UPI002AB2AF08|nr:hypothetical protein [Paraburkholderia tropica]